MTAPPTPFYPDCGKLLDYYFLLLLLNYTYSAKICNPLFCRFHSYRAKSIVCSERVFRQENWCKWPFQMSTFVILGVADSSGIRIYYTSELRKNEGGVFMTGTNIQALKFRPSLVIPPEAPSFTNVGICSSKCTQNVSELSITFKEPSLLKHIKM